MLTHFGGANPPAQGTAFESAAAMLQSRGFTYDFISDRQLRQTRVEGGGLVTGGGGKYRVIVMAAGRFIPLETLEQVLTLARGGATVIALNGWPSDVSGLADLETRRAGLEKALAGVPSGVADAEGVTEARAGQGRILQGKDLARLLDRAGVLRERMVDRGVQFARRADSRGRIYFVSNPTEKPIDGWVPLDTRAPAVTVFDPIDRLCLTLSRFRMALQRVCFPVSRSGVAASSRCPTRCAGPQLADASVRCWPGVGRRADRDHPTQDTEAPCGVG